MSNTDKAADVMYETLSAQYGDFRTPTDAAQALADAGLLAPDLSEIKFDEDGVWREDEEEPDIFVVTQNLPRRFVGIGLVNRDENHVTIHARPVEEMRELAHVLLAAANAAEVEQ